MIVTSAFVPEAAAGGVVGTTVMAGLRTGISRGLFTNEAGLGSIPMAAATAQHVSPRDQALVSMTGPFGIRSSCVQSQELLRFQV